MDDTTRALHKLLWVMLAPKGVTTTNLALQQLEIFKETLSVSNDFPNLKIIKKELEKIFD